jgi:hypothetical protein
MGLRKINGAVFYKQAVPTGLPNKVLNEIQP